MWGRGTRRTNKRLSRRMFLRGAGSAALAIPFLPSLLPRAAWAQAEGEAVDIGKRMVAFTTNHGGVWEEFMYPNAAGLMNAQQLYGVGHDMHWGPLVRSVTGSTASLSPVLSAAASTLTAELANKMFLVRGCDVPFYIAHHTGGYLGNYARNDGNGEEAQGLEMRPTIDQVMAWSDAFYPDISAVKKRSMHIGRSGDTGISWGWSSPSTASGTIQNTPTSFSTMQLFNEIFVPDVPASEVRPPVVDIVLEHYNQLTNGAFGAANRLSYADKQKLTSYMDRLDELERKLNVTAATCGDVAPPAADVNVWAEGFGGWTDDEVNENAITCDLNVIANWYHLWNDVVAAAFVCGTSRIATYHCPETFSTGCNSNAWHQNVAHVAPSDAAKQDILWNSKRFFFENVFLDLATKLDAIPLGDGTTMLDHSLMWWTQESGVVTHESDSMPIVAAGSAGGFFQTGHFYDYRNRDSMALIEPWTEEYGSLQRRPGVSWNQWLATVLQSMGVPPSEFEYAGGKGYGLYHNTRPEAYPGWIEAHASDVLPNITG